MKSSELKEIIQETIEECLNEVAPPGEKSERMVHHLKTSLRKTHPDWDEEKVKQVAYATAWKNKSKNESITESDESDKSEHQYDESDEIKIIEIIHKLSKKLLDMHSSKNKMDESAKVQHRSFKTIKDVDQDPKNANKMDVPQ